MKKLAILTLAGGLAMAQVSLLKPTPKPISPLTPDEKISVLADLGEIDKLAAQLQKKQMDLNKKIEMMKKAHGWPESCKINRALEPAECATGTEGDKK